MRLSVIFAFILLCVACVATPLAAQTEYVSTTYFPADQEFRELKAVRSELEIDKPESMSPLQDGPLFVEAGFKHYARRTYTLEGGKTLSVEVLTLTNSRGAYSLLTLLGGAAIEDGPPGNFHASHGDALEFAEGDFWVRIRSDAAGDLPRRVAVSVGNRIGRRDPERPALVSHFPVAGYEAASMRFFVGPEALAARGYPVAGKPLEFRDLEEIAQARYSMEGQSGTLTLLNFPTIVLADDYFNSTMLAHFSGGTDGSRIYTRRSGPMVSILDGNFDPQIADKTLESINYTYAVKWIYDTNNRRRTVWGVPIGILGTVVRSLVFVALLCLLSIVAGAVIAFGRVAARRRWPKSDDDDQDFIRLHLDK